MKSGLKLLPCPFCGGEGEISYYAKGNSPAPAGYFVECGSCSASGEGFDVQGEMPDRVEYTQQKAKEAWNTRTRAPSAAALVEALEAKRWRALMKCGRIKMQGSAGVDPHTGERRKGGSVHFGAEFWPDDLSADYREKHPKEADNYDQNTKWGIACLIALADQIIEQEAALAAAKGQQP